ncbi:MAG: MarR family transcriptional regulator [Anaerocolumna sp.]|jgi:DNA-binding MarR family transcriptional regulator|nr:MarR family transcriptional regulator [Anaerocolumna sp.]
MEDITNCENKLISKCTCRNIRMTARVTTQYFDKIFQKAGIKAAQFALLSDISSHGTISINELADILLMDQTTVTRNIENLRKLNYVHIEPGKDLRKKYVSISRNGQDKLKEAMPLWIAAQEFLVKEIGEQKYEEFLNTLGEIQRLTRD